MTFLLIVADLVLDLRVVASLLAVYNIRWTFPGAQEVLTGHFRPPAIYLAVVFWFSVAVLVFQASYLAGQTPPWKLLSYVILTVSMGAAAAGHRMGTALKARQFYFLYDHLGVAVAIAELAQVDPGAAEELAAECRRRLAAKMVVAHV